MRIISLLLTIAVVVIILIILGVIGCGTPAVHSDRAADLDFSRYRTFQWTEYRGDTSPEIAKDRFEPAIMNAVSEGLAERGFEETGANPDVLVAYHVVVTAGIDRDEIGVSPARPVDQALIDRTEEGTLILDLIDPELGTVVWRGWSLRGLANLASPETTDLDGAVKEILDRYPNQ